MNAYFLHIRRTPDHLCYIRSCHAPAGIVPSATCLPDREVLAWTLTAAGVPVTLYYIRLDLYRDGLIVYPGHDPLYPRGTAGRPIIKLNQAMPPPLNETASEVVALAEDLERHEVRKYWVEWHTKKADEREVERRLDRERVNQEHIEKLERERKAASAAVIVAKPKAKPKTFLQRMLGQ
jgi:hypothetical protein